MSIREVVSGYLAHHRRSEGDLEEVVAADVAALTDAEIGYLLAQLRDLPDLGSERIREWLLMRGLELVSETSRRSVKRNAASAALAGGHVIAIHKDAMTHGTWMAGCFCDWNGREHTVKADAEAEGNRHLVEVRR